MRAENKPINAWPQRCADWMASMGLLPTELQVLEMQIQDKKAALAKVMKILEKGLPIMECGDELARIQQLKMQAAEETREGRSAEAKTLTEKAKALEEMIRQTPPSVITIESLKPDLERMKREIAEIETLQELLANPSGSSASPKP